MGSISVKDAAIHEAGHAIATLASGCILYHCIVGNVKGVSTERSLGNVSRGTSKGDGHRSSVISVSGAMSTFLYESETVDMDVFLHTFQTAPEYSADRRHIGKTDADFHLLEGYPLLDAAHESKQVLLRRWGHVERLVWHLQRPQNYNRIIEAAEIFQMSGCRLLDSRLLPVPKRKVNQYFRNFCRKPIVRGVGYHQWRDL